MRWRFAPCNARNRDNPITTVFHTDYQDFCLMRRTKTVKIRQIFWICHLETQQSYALQDGLSCFGGVIFLDLLWLRVEIMAKQPPVRQTFFAICFGIS
jgi:hypothetical protein